MEYSLSFEDLEEIDQKIRLGQLSDDLIAKIFRLMYKSPTFCAIIENEVKRQTYKYYDDKRNDFDVALDKLNAEKNVVLESNKIIKAENESLRNKLSVLTKQYDKVIQQQGKIINEKYTLRTNYVKLLTEYNNLLSKYNNLSGEDGTNDKIKDRMMLVENNILADQLEQLKIENNELHSQLSDIQFENSTLHVRIENLRKEITELKKQLS